MMQAQDIPGLLLRAMGRSDRNWTIKQLVERAMPLVNGKHGGFKAVYSQAVKYIGGRTLACRYVPELLAAAGLEIVPCDGDT